MEVAGEEATHDADLIREEQSERKRQDSGSDGQPAVDALGPGAGHEERQADDGRQQGHAGRNANTEDDEIGERRASVLDRRQDQQGHRRASGKAMDQPDDDGTRELVPAHAGEQAVVEPGIGAVTMEVRVAVGMGRIGLVVSMQVIVLVAVQWRRRREALGDPAHPAGEVEDAEGDQHQGDGELHGQADGRRDDDVEDDDQYADQRDGDGVAESPQGTDQRAVQEAAAAIEDGRDGDHVVGIGRVAHAEQKAEAGEGQELGHGGGSPFGKVTSLGRARSYCKRLQ